MRSGVIKEYAGFPCWSSMEEEEEVSAPVQRCPRDFLRRFGSGGGEEPAEAKKGEPSEVEHSLGLSLGRGSGPNDRCTASVFPHRNALPDAAEQRKRKELQSRKRKRSERRDRKGDILDEATEDGRRPSAAASGVVPPLPPALATKPGAGMADGSERFTPEAQASVGSQGSGRPGASDFNCGARQVDATAMTAGRAKGDTKEVERDVMREMPCVSATGEGPNGRRIEGFLYKFKKGEGVRIVCVCHGRFFTPAEFVKHAGGGDVAHPLRHIVVNPFPSAFL